MRRPRPRAVPALIAASAAALFAGATPGAARAQTAGPREVAVNADTWFVYAADLAWSSRWAVLAEVEARRADGLASWQQFLARPAVAYRPAPNVRLTLGYEFQETWPYGGQPAAARTPAHHVWEQLQLGHATGRVLWQHRYRLEQRWIDVPLDSVARDWRYTNRVRYQARATAPLRGRTIDPGELYAAASDEVFLSWGRNVGRNTLDQNRAAALVGWQASRDTRVEGGYMQQLLAKGDGVHLERNHTILLTVTQGVALWHRPHATP